ncbi:MAG: SMP-30/gluconolactonase/LRE family protein [Thalassolituus oleivorans]|uniref:beta-propeller fold lactonase family protein n=1 Tax=Thalassolituus oleivorans TaxID=187493 RepID=UPI001B458713|nr:SMP-30/gluconolactonase/LRE family protein [Thalassolituus oleivorans]MBQ0727655.1 SMP-30/gluconolactonase/LRE family protein [Thalassolituus oleivorans]MBQ0780635.1 SMP-30/gluconolactonase/LRE family protein [Thalassolituus oleivorans]
MTIKIMRRLMPFMASAALSMSALTVHADYNLPDGVPNSFSSKANYTLFETVPVRPMTMSANGQHLYVLNTPDDRVEIYDITTSGLTPSGSVAVGMRPVAIAQAPDGDLWVVNFLSDSISVVDPDTQRVERTLLVGDEPRDIVFAGPNRDRAFITTAHRGQNSPIDPQTFTPSVGRADVWVFDSNNPGNGTQTSPLEILTFFADTPRALASTPDGSKVYVATFNSGNQTTTIHEGATDDYPEENIHGDAQPHKSKIVKLIDGKWIDSVGRDVSEQINFNLPDYDVFTIDATSSTPVAVNGDGAPVSGVGTTLFNMVVNPISGKLYVANTEANNHKRFEGPGLDPEYNTTNRGDFVRSRITIIDDGAATPRHLNKHIDYSHCCAPTGNSEARKSLALPRQMAISSDGERLYVAALGSAKIGVFDTNALETDSFIPAESSQIQLANGGPSGVVLDEARNKLYVRTQFNNGIAVIDLDNNSEVQTIAMHSPEPENIAQGRAFLYDAFNTSSHGDSACAGCHVDGDIDHIAWDLGDPTAVTRDVPGSWLSRTGIAILLPTNSTVNAIETCAIIPFNLLPCAKEESFHFNSLKGPMLTQTMAGMDNHGPMHWRGDRTGGEAWYAGKQPNDGMFDERVAFAGFNVAFPGLLGRDSKLTDEEIGVFTDFALQNTLAPNPHRHLDNSLTERQAKGKEIFFGGPDGDRLTDITRNCSGCHITDLKGNEEYGVEHPGFFGSDGRYAFVFEPEMLKVPHLRNVYQRVGMFTLHDTSVQMEWEGKTYDMPHFFFPFTDPKETGDQIRGFGYTKDGSVGEVATFLQNGAFIDYGPITLNLVNPGGFQPYVEPGTWPSDLAAYNQEGFLKYAYLAITNGDYFSETNPETGEPVGREELRSVEDFVMVFPNNMAPIMGQQITLSANTSGSELDRLFMMEERAAVTEPRKECDLVARADGLGLLYDPASNQYISSDLNRYSRSALLALAPEVTFTCVPPGDGLRVALDRDLDGYFDAIELAANTDPANADSYPVTNSWWARIWKWLIG